MVEEPLFIRYVNGTISEEQIIKNIVSGVVDKRTIEIINKTKDSVLSSDYSVFRRDFRNLILDLIDNGITQRLINYVNSYMKSSLEEFVENDSINRASEKRYISIKGEDVPWLEAILCYNLCIYIKVYGIKSIKQCPVCNKIFSTKGKYAKYCSDICKQKEV